MEPQVIKWIATTIFGVGGIVFFLKALHLHHCGRPDTLTEEMEIRLSDLNQQKEEVLNKIKEMEEKKQKLGDSCEISNIEWCIDDNRWRLQDIEWETRDTRWEFTDRNHQEQTSKATFWAVLGAVLLALSSLSFCIFLELIG